MLTSLQIYFGVQEAGLRHASFKGGPGTDPRGAESRLTPQVAQTLLVAADLSSCVQIGYCEGDCVLEI